MYRALARGGLAKSTAWVPAVAEVVVASPLAQTYVATTMLVGGAAATVGCTFMHAGRLPTETAPALAGVLIPAGYYTLVIPAGVLAGPVLVPAVLGVAVLDHLVCRTLQWAESADERAMMRARRPPL